jgi:hypothetical protein
MMRWLLDNALGPAVGALIGVAVRHYTPMVWVALLKKLGRA